MNFERIDENWLEAEIEQIWYWNESNLQQPIDGDD